MPGLRCTPQPRNAVRFPTHPLHLMKVREVCDVFLRLNQTPYLLAKWPHIMYSQLPNELASS